MLTSAGDPEDVMRCRRLGISAYLTKPIKQSELFDVIVTAISEPVVEKAKRKAPPKRSGLHVLLAEDNQVNQLVATRIIEKLGHQVTVVSNGREAVSALQSRTFDLVVMDVQMPEMDGLEATAAIRDFEEPTGRHTPIIAVTAHAMKGDRERCLEAGMDGYTSKPIRIKELAQVIAELALTRDARGDAAEEDQKHSVIDHASLLDAFDGSRSLLNKVVRLFLADYPKRMEEIKQSIDRSDSTALTRAAHGLKGSVGTFAAKGAFAIAQRLETMGKNGQLHNAGREFVALESELKLLSKELKRITSERTRGLTKRVARKAGGLVG
jgi:CheY-like chemotaxis protein